MLKNCSNSWSVWGCCSPWKLFPFFMFRGLLFRIPRGVMIVFFYRAGSAIYCTGYRTLEPAAPLRAAIITLMISMANLAQFIFSFAIAIQFIIDTKNTRCKKQELCNECAVASSYLMVFTNGYADSCKDYSGNEACDGYNVFYFPVVLHFSSLVRVYGHLRYTGAREIRECEDQGLGSSSSSELGAEPAVTPA